MNRREERQQRLEEYRLRVRAGRELRKEEKEARRAALRTKMESLRSKKGGK